MKYKLKCRHKYWQTNSDMNRNSDRTTNTDNYWTIIHKDLEVSSVIRNCFLPLAGAVDVALGSAAAGVFTNSDWLWGELYKVLWVIWALELCWLLQCARLTLHNLSAQLSQSSPINVLCVCVFSGKCCHRWSGLEDALVSALYQTSHRERPGWPEQHRQIQSVSEHPYCQTKVKHTLGMASFGAV